MRKVNATMSLPLTIKINLSQKFHLDLMCTLAHKQQELIKQLTKGSFIAGKNDVAALALE